MPLPRDPVRRRRLAVLGAVAATSALGGIAVGAGAGDEAPPTVEMTASSAVATRESAPASAGTAAPPSTAALMREAGQTIVLRFAGPSAPAWALRALRERRAAGVILFADNLRSPGQVRALTRTLQRAAGGRALVMTDQEGGEVRRLPWAAPDRPASRIRTRGAATAIAKATARDLRAAGVNVDLAPVADVGAHPGSIMRERAFPGDAGQVAPLVAATVRAYEAGGVRATAKHFPGLGPARTNTDFGTATVRGRGDLEPFRAAIGARTSLVMADHALHPAYDRTRIASQSRRIVTGLLRERLGFNGACVTDALEAKAVLQRADVATAALRSMRAGCDLLLTSVPGSYLEVLRRLVASARADPALRRRLREARARIRPLLPPAARR